MSWFAAALLLAGCSVARRADELPPEPVRLAAPVPTVVAPPQAEGLDGRAGQPGKHACSAVSSADNTIRRPRSQWVAKPYSWNDGGLPAMDLCTLTVDGRTAVVGITALAARPGMLERVADAAEMFEPAAKLGAPAQDLGYGARTSGRGVVFEVADRVVRITSDTGLPDGELLRVAVSVHKVVPQVLRPARQSDSACQLSTAMVERFIGVLVQLRRDYRVNGALTCIWGTNDTTVAIVESVHPDEIPEARQVPPPRPAPIGRPGYYLPDRGELVFRQGRRVVRVSALTVPAREIPLDTLIGIVQPLLPLFLR
ncbi:hypothetical protein Kfla_3365 [Kribbella flavida DSM 17836]|uniref:Uncharacterized protein n=1 Tax=Kribbella flavida (strain DSM 17836 / JCM 10339 / NBRC 14399) TaxID=479435 RepID=D2PKV8_KRIFD|nr:hypothetical protein [Kribbella flavida]ADB32425.1 hypothetical protein Kfla_3365 [Kribbella flavida DSM 17836]